MENRTIPRRSEIARLVILCLQDVLSRMDRSFGSTVSESSCLIGGEAVLDSLGLVSLLVDLEQRLEDQYGLPITLADDRAMSQKNSPFRTATALTDYICLLSEEALEHNGA